MTIRFEVAGHAVAQGRPRMTRTGHVYTPKKSADYRTLLIHEAKLAYGNNPPSGKLALIKVNVYTQAPKSLKAEQRKIIESGLPLPSGKRPDADNYLKMVMDALNGVVLRDDAQIYSAMVNKWIAARPRIEVEIIGL